jgi:protein-tyrosine-phosphatase
MITVLMICTANLCRSPMAEAILKKQASERSDAEQWHIESAGVWAQDGKPPSFLSKYVMEMMGMDISQKQSQSVSRKLLQNFDLILTMEEEHKDWLKEQYGETADRVYMLSEMVGEVADIPDPIGGELFEYQEVAQLLQHIITDGYEQIYQLAKVHQQEM